MAQTKKRAPANQSIDIAIEPLPFRAPKTAELVARELRNKIVRGELREGETLPSEAELVAQFQLSRPTLREALRILESENLLTVTRGSRGGPRIHLPDPRFAARHFGLVLQSRGTTLADIYNARLLVEPSCVRYVTVESRRKAVPLLRQLIAEERRTLDDDAAHSSASTRFHRALIELTANTPLVLMMGMLNHIYAHHVTPATLAANVIKLDAASKQRTLRTHEELVELIESGDGEAAESFWRKYLESIDKVIRKTVAVDKVIDILDQQ